MNVTVVLKSKEMQYKLELLELLNRSLFLVLLCKVSNEDLSCACVNPLTSLLTYSPYYNNMEGVLFFF